MQQNFFGHLRQFLWELLNVILREEWWLYKPADKETISVWGTEQDAVQIIADPGSDSRGVVG